MGLVVRWSSERTRSRRSARCATACRVGWFNGLQNRNISLPVACDQGLTDVSWQHSPDLVRRPKKRTSTAVFAQMDYDLTDQLTLTAGLRWTKEEKDFVAGQSYLTSPDREALRQFPAYAELDQEWTEVSPKRGLDLRNRRQLLWCFATYSEGFKSGGFFGVNQNIADFERDQYDPEYAGNIEIGYKSQHLNNRLRFNATYFRNDYDRKQEAFGVHSTRAQWRQLFLKTSVSGFEASKLKCSMCSITTFEGLLITVP